MTTKGKPATPPRQWRMWGIRHKDSRENLNYIYALKAWSIEDFISAYLYPRKWKYYYRRGWRCVAVTVTEGHRK